MQPGIRYKGVPTHGESTPAVGKIALRDSSWLTGTRRYRRRTISQGACQTPPQHVLTHLLWEVNSTFIVVVHQHVNVANTSCFPASSVCHRTKLFRHKTPSKFCVDTEGTANQGTLRLHKTTAKRTSDKEECCVHVKEISPRVDLLWKKFQREVPERTTTFTEAEIGHL